MLSRTYMGNHLNNDCPRRQYECPHCQETGEYQERTTAHMEICPGVKVHCSNSPCPIEIIQSKLSTHRSTCQYELVSCKYAAVGCEEKLLRKDLTKHEENDQLHLRMTIEKNHLFDLSVSLKTGVATESLLYDEYHNLSPLFVYFLQQSLMTYKIH